MRASNFVFVGLAVVASAALLWLWFYLGFCRIDDPTDLLLAGAWWIVIAAAAAGIHFVEKKRKEQRRTAYVSAGYVYNPEAGVCALEDSAKGAFATEGCAATRTVQTVQGMLENLRYDFQIAPAPEDCAQAVTHIVHSKTFKVQDSVDQTAAPAASLKEIVEWTGEVVLAGRPGAQPKPFNSKEELVALLA